MFAEVANYANDAGKWFSHVFVVFPSSVVFGRRFPEILVVLGIMLWPFSRNKGI